MAGKSDSSTPGSTSEPGIKDSAQQIWLAGLGAFAKAQQEGGKVFEALVKDGLATQRKTQETARSQMAEASEKLSAMTGGLGSRAGQQWDKLEGIFEDRVARALQRLDVASREELHELRERVQALEAQLRASQTAPAKRGRSTQASPAAKAPARRSKKTD